jgi:hypothetical protein
MALQDESQNLNPEARWLKEDLALEKALQQLKGAKSHYEAQIALNIIKIIIEHAIEEHAALMPDFAAYESLPAKQSPWYHKDKNYRYWYDLLETLSSASRLLEDIPGDLHAQVIPSIAQMIEGSLRKADDA